MQTYTVRDLREHTGDLIRGAEAGNWAIVSKHGTPVIIAAPFNQIALEHGVQVALAQKLFDDNVITLRQAAKMAGISLADFMALCTARKIPIVRLSADEFAAELAHVETLASCR